MDSQYLFRFSAVVQNAAIEAKHWHDELNSQPNHYGQYLSTFKNLFAEFEADDHFSEENGTKDPALSADSSASSISHKSVVLSKNENKESADDNISANGQVKSFLPNGRSYY